MNGKDDLIRALALLGDVLEHRGLSFDVVVIGGGALLLHDLISRPTLDLDAIALAEGDEWVRSKPLPSPLVDAVREVADALDLPREPRDEKDWLNGGPAFLLKLGLPSGFQDRAHAQRFGGLTVRVADRRDLICLKLWSATDSRRGARRSVDIDDLKEMSPSKQELGQALDWCAKMDGRSDFIKVEALPVLQQLGHTLETLRDG